MLLVGQNGEFVTRMERKMHKNDYHFDKPIDKYFTDHKVNRLIYESRKEQQRFKQLIKLEAPKYRSTFEELYRKIRQEKIKPLIEKEKRMFEQRASRFEKKRKSLQEQALSRRNIVSAKESGKN